MSAHLILQLDKKDNILVTLQGLTPGMVEAGAIIGGKKSIPQMEKRFWSCVLNQDDFIPWKRGVSL